MERGEAQQRLLQKIDQIAEELLQLRREVASLLVREAEAVAKAEAATAHADEPSPVQEGIMQDTEHATHSAPYGESISSLGEQYNRDFRAIANKEEPIDEDHVRDSSLMYEESPETYSTHIEGHDAELELVPKDNTHKEDLNSFFLPSGSEEVLESTFEPMLHFDLINNLSIADRFLFANELCNADQAELMEMLEDIERLSSWSQVESYLYQVRRFDKDEEAVKLLAHFIRENSKR